MDILQLIAAVVSILVPILSLLMWLVDRGIRGIVRRRIVEGKEPSVAPGWALDPAETWETANPLEVVATLLLRLIARLHNAARILRFYKKRGLLSELPDQSTMRSRKFSEVEIDIDRQVTEFVARVPDELAQMQDEMAAAYLDGLRDGSRRAQDWLERNERDLRAVRRRSLLRTIIRFLVKIIPILRRA